MERLRCIARTAGGCLVYLRNLDLLVAAIGERVWTENRGNGVSLSDTWENAEVKVSLAQYRELAYAERSRPSIKTIRSRAKNNELPYYAEIEGGRWYIDLARPRIRNPLVERIITA